MGSRNLKPSVLNGAEVKFHLLPLSSCLCELSEAPLQDRLFKHGCWPVLSVWPQDWAATSRGPNTIICVHKEGNRLPISCANSSTSCHRCRFVGVLRHHVCPTDSYNYTTLLLHIAAWACNTSYRRQWIQLPVEKCKHLNQNKYFYLSFHAYSFSNCHSLGCMSCFMAVVAASVASCKIAMQKS